MSKSPKTFWITLIAAGLATATGLTVIFGWYLQSRTIVQIFPGFAPMQYNTALCLLLISSGILALLFRRNTLAILTGGAGTLIAVLSLAQYVFNIDLGIDQLAVQPFVTDRTSHPGRMAPNTALSFSVAGLGLLFLAVKTEFLSQQVLVAAFLAIIVKTLAMVAIYGYIQNVEAAYGWGHMTRMALHTSISVLLVGIALLATSWELRPTEDIKTFEWKAISVFAAGLLVSLFLWHALARQGNDQIREIMDEEVKYLKLRIEQAFNSRLLGLQRMASRWNVRGGYPQKEWQVDAKLIYQHHPGYQAIEWVDNSYRINWVVPLTGNEAILNRNLTFGNTRINAAQLARERRETTVTAPIDLVQGGKGFIAYFPLFPADRFDGFILGVFSARSLFDQIIRNDLLQEEGERRVVGLYYDNEQIYLSDESELAVQNLWEASEEVRFNNITLQLRIWPETRFMHIAASMLPIIALITGLFLTTLAGLVVHLAQRTKLRAEVIESTNEQLAQEIEERQQAQDALQTARDQLEIRVQERTAALSRANEALQLSEAKYLQLYESAPDMFVSASYETGTIAQCNQTLVNRMGFSKSEIIGRSLAELYTEGSQEKFSQALKEFNDTGSVKNVKLDLKTASKTQVTVRLNMSGIADASGKVRITNSVLRDITELEIAQNEIQKSEERFRVILESLPSAIVLVNESGQIELMNPQAKAYFGYEAEEAIGHSIEILIPKRYARKHAGYFRHYWKDMEPRPMGENRDLFARRKDGSEFPVEVGLTPCRISNRTYVMSVIIDITERRQTQEALRKKSDALMRSNQELQQFAYIASHDLQEPLRTIINFSDRLSTKMQGKLDDKTEQYLAFIVDGAARMRQLITDLLNFSRVDKVREPLHEVDCNVIVNSVIKTLNASILETGATVQTAELPKIMGNTSQVTQLFQNLIGNALKFRSDKPAEIDINVSELQEMWQFSVRDNGIGIPEESQERIFAVFNRLHTRTEYSGTGVGLAICKKIVEQYGGKIWVESKPEEGATFFFTIPKEPVQE